MGILIAQNALLLNAGRNVQRACLIVRLSRMILVDIIVSRMEAGNKESTQEFIEILGQLRHSVNLWA